ncbi:SDR family oxidoreductase [Kiloniella laminariae]|uniref:dTDP-4-dehydrorhamnose reductase n=1 Tax=Kiloniella laminariae TaxID=454162 RepID=A0ABT4LML9_9PROT|nr:SDR family oxidoreductase [Kiloniella laminariae]MCZ4282354.1 SDR family oxidoreductase [Kiloniella laminariae]
MKWLITGASGLLGSALCAELNNKHSVAIGLINHHKIKIDKALIKKCDITDKNAISHVLESAAPTIIIHCAALTNIDQCETNLNLATELHVTAPTLMAKWAYNNSCKMVYISTDHLWDGTQKYVPETLQPVPLNNYAETKSNGEQQVLAANPKALIARTNFYGKGLEWRPSFSDWIISSLQKREDLNGYTDIHFTPLHRKQLINLLLDLISLDARGIYNVVSSERISKYDFIKKVATKFGLPEEKVKGIKSCETKSQTPRPKDMSLSSQKISTFLGRKMPSIDEGIDDLYTEMNG